MTNEAVQLISNSDPVFAPEIVWLVSSLQSDCIVEVGQLSLFFQILPLLLREQGSLTKAMSAKANHFAICVFSHSADFVE